MAEGAPDIAVVGAGALGLATALVLSRAGLRVRVFDDARERPNASAVAAGMLAPVSETLAERAGARHLRRLLCARDLWPAFAQSVPGIHLDRSGLEWRVADGQGMEAIIPLLSAWGIDFSPLAPPHAGVHLADDWRLDARTALAAMRAALLERGAGVESATVTADPAGAFHIDSGPLRAGGVVIAGGHAGRALAAAAPELAVLTPIKGQIVAFAPSQLGGPAVRSAAIYVAPQRGGARAGATMEVGRDDDTIETAVIERLHSGAVAMQPALAGAAYHGEAGVRAATPDGWPLIGPSATPGVFLATGARRNGWLLAPLAARMIADRIIGNGRVPSGASPWPALEQAFHPGRFTR